MTEPTHERFTDPGDDRSEEPATEQDELDQLSTDYCEGEEWRR